MISDLQKDLAQLNSAMSRFRKTELFEIPNSRVDNSVCLGAKQEIEEEIEIFKRANSMDWENPEIEDVLPYSEPQITMGTETFFYLLPRLLSAILIFFPNDERVCDTYAHIGIRLIQLENISFIQKKLTAEEMAILIRVLARFDDEVFRGQTRVAKSLSDALSLPR